MAKEKCYGRDGLIARESGPWVVEKLRPLQRYADIVTTAMPGKFPAGVVFVDLMAGSGRCVDVRSVGRPEYEGSTLIALQSTRPFSAVIAVESDPANAEALRQRSAGLPKQARIIAADCNAPETIRTLRDATNRALTLMFVDLLGTEVAYDTIVALTHQRSVDLLITWPEMDLRRNRALALERPDRLDRFFGTQEWREIVRAQGPTRFLRAYQELYERQLRRIRYEHTHMLGPVKNRRGGTLYRALFASRHPLGLNFWRKAADDAARPALFDLR